MVVHVKVWQVVTFAVEPFRGNPAFVVGLEHDLPAETLRAIGTQFSGVTAVLGPDQGEVVRLRFVTAAGPHPGAGHAAAAAAAIALEGRPEVEVSFEDDSRRRFWRDALGRVVVPWPVMPWSTCEPGPVLATALGRPPEQWLVASFGYVAVYPDESSLRHLTPDMAALSTLDRNAVIATAPGDSGASDIVIRVFAPKVGLPEDPVCGTAHRIIVPFWSERLGRTKLHSRHLSIRGGDLWCEVHEATVTIAGDTYRFLEGTVRLFL
jgi:predicted PhzF superfamily epimerase YddE/YHI9